MQKLVTIAIDTTQLKQTQLSPFAVNEVDEINELLELGWQIEEWDFLKETDMDGQVMLLVILNDEQMYDAQEDQFDMDFEEEEEIDAHTQLKNNSGGNNI